MAAASEVKDMFDRIASVYDPMNAVMSAGLDSRWRERAADQARLGPGDCALDVATGTGDLAFELAKRVGPSGSIVGADFSEKMLERARAKEAALLAAEKPEFAWEFADALDLPYPTDCFDAVTVGFGVRNFADLDKGLAELVRVVRPGGRVVILELTNPTRQPLATFFSLWFDALVPTIGRFAGDSDAYSYLPNSVREFPDPTTLADRLDAVGLAEISWLITGGGIVAIHAGTVRDNGRG